MSDEHARGGLGYRPTEYLELDEERPAVKERLRTGLEARGETLDTRWAGAHVLFTLAAARRQLWSPWLSVALRDSAGDDRKGTTVVAQFCPHPQLWTAVMLGNIALASIFVLAAGFGWAQLALKREAWALWVALAAALGVLVLWLGGQLGQRLARAQMDELWDALTGSLGPGARRN